MVNQNDKYCMDDIYAIRLITQKMVAYGLDIECKPELLPYAVGQMVAKLFAEYKISEMSFENYAFALGVNDPETLISKWATLDEHYKDDKSDD